MLLTLPIMPKNFPYYPHNYAISYSIKSTKNKNFI